MGFSFDTDPLASANASVARTYYFVRPAKNDVPALRLCMGKALVTSGNKWIVSFTNADQGGILESTTLPKLRVATVEPKDVLSTIQRFCAEIDNEFLERQKPSASVSQTVDHVCRNCGQQIENVMQEFCGQPNCDERAAVRRHS